MGSGSISSAYAPVPAVSAKNSKKKANRLAKLKRCKLDVRREQWLSQVKSKGCNVDSNESSRSMDNLETRSRGVEKEGLSRNDSDLESLMNSPTRTVLGHNDSGKHLGSSSCSSTSSSGFYSQSVSEEGEEEEGCLDDWEAVADALTTDENHRSLGQPVISVSPCSPQQPDDNRRVDRVKTDTRGVDYGSTPFPRAWRPDDAYRPRSLPNLSKQQCSPVNSGWHCGHGRAIPWGWQSIVSQPSSCPICYEDLDLTDSSFLPCSCGFRLCLFCHKRIMEADGRCPGCRKQYDSKNGNIGFKAGVTSFHMTQFLHLEH